MLAAFGFAFACFATASAGAIFAPGEWYESLRKPSWNPPNWAFPVVWTIIFIMIGTSGWLVWREAGWSGAALPLVIYGVQLVLNFLWSALFFGMKRMDLAFYEVLLLWLSIALLIGLFYPISPLAAWLLVPYIVWVSIAATLNFTVWRLNSPVQP